MADLIVHAPAKINLHLEVLGLRPDGFHELAMVMQSIDLADTLELRPTADAAIRLVCDQTELPTDGNNLIVRAGELLRSRSGLPELGARIQLHKRIPIGAGLAGGSSDAAATLIGLNRLWGLNLPMPALLDMAAELGSDVPFCLNGGTQLCFGRGDVLEAVTAPAALALGVLLIKNPTVSVSTPWAYGRCRERCSERDLQGEAAFAERRRELRQGTLLDALQRGEALPPIRNDLQTVVAPEVKSVRQGLALLEQAPGVLAVAMSGSGPSLFAVFPSAAAAAEAAVQLATPLAAAGFEHWCCRPTSSGVSLESAT
ncbi:MAG: 4-(cytidine 5'-diphospho)-2-C-methyl-D-erythritol kinase [Cyanobacteriota bacterium]